MVMEAVARDGESLVWLRRGKQFGKFAFQLQILPADHLDENYYGSTTDGNTIFQGVELDPFGKPVAYHIWERNPADVMLMSVQRINKRIRVEASDILHIFDQERAEQVRGYPWAAASMDLLYQITEYRDAEVVCARTSAEKRFFYKQQDNVGFSGEDEPDDAGNITFESNPGAFEILPRGWDVQAVDFKSPNADLASFQKTVLRGVAAGLGVSYNTLASDLESVNYSSARFGGLEDQAQYRSMQNFFINAFVAPVFENWLSMQLLTNNWGLNLPTTRFDKFKQVKYTPRSWQSVDPIKQIKADVAAVTNGLSSWSEVIQSSGRDPEEVMLQIASDKKRMKELDITPLDIQIQTATLTAVKPVEAPAQTLAP
jgi:lambda family phage portal protein